LTHLKPSPYCMQKNAHYTYRPQNNFLTSQ